MGVVANNRAFEGLGEWINIRSESVNGKDPQDSSAVAEVLGQVSAVENLARQDEGKEIKGFEDFVMLESASESKEDLKAENQFNDEIEQFHLFAQKQDESTNQVKDSAKVESPIAIRDQWVVTDRKYKDSMTFSNGVKAFKVVKNSIDVIKKLGFAAAAATLCYTAPITIGIMTSVIALAALVDSNKNTHYSERALGLCTMLSTIVCGFYAPYIACGLGLTWGSATQNHLRGSLITLTGIDLPRSLAIPLTIVAGAIGKGVSYLFEQPDTEATFLNKVMNYFVAKSSNKAANIAFDMANSHAEQVGKNVIENIVKFPGAVKQLFSGLLQGVLGLKAIYDDYKLERKVDSEGTVDLQLGVEQPEQKVRRFNGMPEIIEEYSGKQSWQARVKEVVEPRVSTII